MSKEEKSLKEALKVLQKGPTDDHLLKILVKWAPKVEEPKEMWQQLEDEIESESHRNEIIAFLKKGYD